jgi:hypothetical protein
MTSSQEGPVEDPLVRQYRFLLRTAPLDALEAAHVEALSPLPADVRGAVLVAVQEGLVAGGRLRPDDVAAVARLLSRGERRSPGGFLRAVDPSTLGTVAQAVVASEAVFGLFAGYAAWDGAEPEAADVGVDHGGGPRRRGPLDVVVEQGRAVAYGNGPVPGGFFPSGG